MSLVGLAVSLILVIIASRRGINLGHSLVAGCLVLGLTGSLSPAEFGLAVRDGLISPNSLMLLFIIAGLMVLVKLQEISGQWEQVLDRFRTLIKSSKLRLAIFPAMIGLLPMPGGSVFSAPLVDKLADGFNLGPVRKSLINYWFRHIWEYCWPLYPAVVMAAGMGNIDIGELLRYTWPVTVLAAAIGFATVMRGIGADPPRRPGNGRAGGSLLLGLGPVLLVVFGALIGPVLLEAIADGWPSPARPPKATGMAVALVIAIFWVSGKGNRLRNIGASILNKHTGSIVYLVAAVFSFKSVAVASGALPEMGRLITESGLPLFVVAALAPFLTGLITGYAVAYVAAGFPIFVGLVPQESMAIYLMIGHISGFAGVLISPAHACLVLSNQYFNTPAGPFYRRLWPPVVVVAVFGLLLAWAYLS